MVSPGARSTGATTPRTRLRWVLLLPARGLQRRMPACLHTPFLQVLPVY